MKKSQKKKKWVSYIRRNIIDPLEKKHLKNPIGLSDRHSTFWICKRGSYFLFRIKIFLNSLLCNSKLFIIFCTCKLIQ